MHILLKMLRDEDGATAVEYGLIAALLVIAIFVTLNSFAAQSITMWTGVSERIDTAIKND